MGNSPIKSLGQTSDEQSLLSQVTLYFEYNKTISQARTETRAKQASSNAR